MYSSCKSSKYTARRVLETKRRKACWRPLVSFLWFVSFFLFFFAVFLPNIPADLFHICRLQGKFIYSGVYFKKMSTPKGDSRLVEKTKAVYVTFFHCSCFRSTSSCLVCYVLVEYFSTFVGILPVNLQFGLSLLSLIRPNTLSQQSSQTAGPSENVIQYTHVLILFVHRVAGLSSRSAKSRLLYPCWCQLSVWVFRQDRGLLHRRASPSDKWHESGRN